MCNEVCAASPSHKPECEMTLARGHPMQIEVVSGKPFPLYETVAIMRCLYLKVTAPDKYKALMALEPHTEERKRNGRYVFTFTQISNVIKNFDSWRSLISI